MRKKLVLLAVAAAVMITACAVRTGTEKKPGEPGMTQEESAIEEEGQSSGTENQELSESFQAENQESPEVSQAEIPKQEAEEPAGQEENVPEFSKGTLSESGWESEWIGMRFTAPEGSRMSTEEELDQLMGISEELLAEDLSKAQLKYAELISVREMMCYDELTKSNVIVNVDRMPFEMSEEDYSAQLELSLTSVSAMKYEKQGEDEMAEIAGIPYLKCVYRVEGMGQIMHTDYYVRMINDRAVSLAVTYGKGNEEQAASLLGGFSASGTARLNSY
ncbi:MAG: hypothetical protein NC429_10390 [Lachnospiraceae bacterium]|nr:hypothetical protein [Lachnospiraceae bacterium]